MENSQIRDEVATALLFDRDGKFLIYLRDDKPSIPFPNHWDLFGGHIEEGESAEAALLRELEEELDVKRIEHRKFRDYYCLVGDNRPNVKHVYWVKIDARWTDLTCASPKCHPQAK